MALDLLNSEKGVVPASYLVARLCEEAEVCLDDAEGNRVLMMKASFTVGRGLVVVDREGKHWRLRITAVPEKDVLG